MDTYIDKVDLSKLKKINPLELLTPERLDIPLRAMVLHRNDTNTLTSFYKKLYAKLVLFRNGAYEPREFFSIAETKNNVEDYLESAMEAYTNIRDRGFDKKAFVAVNNQKQIVDGSHRIASSILLETQLWVGVVEHTNREQFNYLWFDKHYFNSLEMLIILKEYLKYKGGILNISFDQDLKKFSKHNSNIIGYTEIPCTPQLSSILKEEFIPYGTGSWPDDFCGMINIRFTTQVDSSTRQSKIGNIETIVPFTNIIYDFLNLNSIFLFSNYQLNLEMREMIRELASLISDKQKAHILLCGAFSINLFEGYFSKEDLIIGVDSEEILKQLISIFIANVHFNNLKIKKIDNVSQYVDSDDTFNLYGMHILLPFSLKRENIIKTAFYNQVQYDNFLEKAINCRKEYRERSHYLSMTNYYMLYDWRN